MESLCLSSGQSELKMASLWEEVAHQGQGVMGVLQGSGHEDVGVPDPTAKPAVVALPSTGNRTIYNTYSTRN